VSKNAIKILSFDGGGVRALAGLIFLSNFEKHTGKKVFDEFDFFSGVSAGALNAFGFACRGFSALETENLWSEYFLKKIKTPENFWDKYSPIQTKPKYTNKGRAEVLEKIFPDMMLGESLKPVLTLAYDVEDRRPKILSSYNYPGLSLVDACSATSAAPIYFPTYKTEADEWFIDGGVVTNNPALISYTEAKQYFNTDDIKILSIGTGINTRKIPGKKSSQWGGLGWLRHDIMGIMLETQIEHKIAKDLLKTKYLRINSPLGKVNRRLDDDSKVNLERICMLGNHWWDLFKNETIDFLDDN
tara:strand:- start:275 stop:1177 length:903 start_codon:yes stop_codon:yes gene_type:complete